MTRNVLTLAVSSAAIIIATPAVGHPGGGHGANSGATGLTHAGTSSFGSMSGTGAFSNPILGSERSMNSPSRTTNIHSSQKQDEQGEISQGEANNRLADQERANELGARVPSALLPGLTAGLSVHASGGASLGTISGVLTADGSIKGVIVTMANGQTVKVPASALSISGNVVTVNTADAFEGGRIPAALLPGLTTGLTVNTGTGSTLGTIASIQTAGNGSIGSVTIAAANGQTYKVPAGALSISGKIVTLNTAEAFERSGVPAALLPGLAAGLAIKTAAGTSLGTVSQVITGENGTINAVVVTGLNNQKLTIPASALSISGNAATVNTAEAFEGRSVPSMFLPGLSAGLTVRSGSGTSLGTISNVLSSTDGAISGVIVTASNGQRFIVPASELSISGNVVTVIGVG